MLQTLRGLWAQFWAYLQAYYAPAIAAWQAAWGQMSAAAAAVWEPLRAAVMQLWTGALQPLFQYLATVFWPGVVNSFSQAFAPVVGGAVSTALTVLGNTFTWLCGLISEAVTTVVQPALAFLLTVWQGLMTGIQTAWAAYGQPLLDGVVLAFQNMTDLLSALWSGVLQPVFAQLMTQLSNLWNNSLNPLWQQLTLALGAVMNLILTLWNTVLAPLLAWLAATFSPAFTQAFAAVSSAVGVAVTVISGAITAVLAVLRGLADFVTNVLCGDWNAAWESLSATVETVWDTITSTVTNAVDGLISTVTGLAEAIGSAFAGVWEVLSGAGSAVSGALQTAGSWISGRSAAPALQYARTMQIPALASGAVIPPNRAFLAVLGDQRHGTNVEAPLATIQEAVAAAMQDLQDGELAALGQVLAALREILEAIYGIRIGDELIGRAADRYQTRQAIMTGRV